MNSRAIALIILIVSFHLTASAQDCCSKRNQWTVDENTPATIIPNIGANHIEITTTSDSAQIYFDQGLRLVHCFWDFEAYRSFNKALSFDSTCAMAYWGLAYIYYNADYYWQS